MTVLAQVVDPDGRRVELTVERWEHIVDDRDGHPELSAYIATSCWRSVSHTSNAPAAATTNCGTSVETSARAVGCR